MTDGKSKSLVRKKYLAAYVFVLLVYATAGGVLLYIVLPDFPLPLLMVVVGLAAAKLDSQFNGPASKFERKYVAQMEK